MPEFNRKQHWETIYTTKDTTKVSWYQPIPKSSLQIFEELNLPKTAKIIDVGAGDSFLVDHLLERGYQEITVLDISQTAIEKARQRLGKKASQVKWLVADAANFHPPELYDIWHDRAAFHFLTNEKDINNYVQSAYQSLTTSGKLVVGTFSTKGPKKCSGISIKQYSEVSMKTSFAPYFNKVKCFSIDHETPSGKLQHFIFCAFTKQLV